MRTLSNSGILTAAIPPTYSEQSLCFWDLETTGLSSARNHIITAGAMEVKGHHYVLRQWFLDHPGEEAEMLQAFVTGLGETDPLVTFNGRSFDVPFLNARLRHWGLPDALPRGRTYDLLMVARKALPTLKSHTLKAVEAALGIHRDDGISGADCVALYDSYLKEGNEEAARLILQHNHEDILNMAPLLVIPELLGGADPLRELPRPLRVLDRSWWTTEIRIDPTMLHLCAEASRPVQRSYSHHAGPIAATARERLLEVHLPIFGLPYPEPDSFYLDADRCPELYPEGFNGLSSQDRLKLNLGTFRRDSTPALSAFLDALFLRPE